MRRDRPCHAPPHTRALPTGRLCSKSDNAPRESARARRRRESLPGRADAHLRARGVRRHEPAGPDSLPPPPLLQSISEGRNDTPTYRLGAALPLPPGGRRAAQAASLAHAARKGAHAAFIPPAFRFRGAHLASPRLASRRDAQPQTAHAGAGGGAGGGGGLTWGLNCRGP